MFHFDGRLHSKKLGKERQHTLFCTFFTVTFVLYQPRLSIVCESLWSFNVVFCSSCFFPIR